jgi:hypothetical protein
MLSLFADFVVSAHVMNTAHTAAESAHNDTIAEKIIMGDVVFVTNTIILINIPKTMYIAPNDAYIRHLAALRKVNSPDTNVMKNIASNTTPAKNSAAVTALMSCMN